MTSTLIETLPGENAPLEFTADRGPVTEAEALGVARRLARKEIALGRPNSRAFVPDELPSAAENRVSSLFRLPPRMMTFVRARAEMEGRTVTAVVEELLSGYAAGTPQKPTA